MNLTNKESCRGFTLIEVMIALVVFLISVSGLVALQKASIDGAFKSRQATAANNIARYFLTELKNEMQAWRPDIADPGTDLPLVDAALDNGQGVWTTLDSSGTLRVDPYLGHTEKFADGGNFRYCVNYRLEPMDFHAGDELGDPLLWTLRVRVAWTRAKQFNLTDEAWTDCTVDAVEARIQANGSDDVVELVSVVTREVVR